MPKLRATAVSRFGGSEVPEELKNPHALLWASPEAVTEWLSANGLPSRYMGEDGPLTRHDAAVRAWAIAHGWTHQVGGAKNWIDWARLREEGIIPNSGAVMIERLERAGVTIAPH